MKVLIIGASHGNELLGTKLYIRLLKTKSPLLEHVDFIVGNPRAFATNERFTESDLNRSYQSSDATYEAKRARQITTYVRATKPDIILDMHTTTCDQPSCLVVGEDISGEMMRRLLGASHIDKLLQVQPLGDILSLGGFVVGYEVSESRVTNTLLDDIAGDIERFVKNQQRHRTKQLYTMSGKIYRKDMSEDEAARLINFEEHKEGFVPILVGERAYKSTDYIGFKAETPVEVIL